MIKSMTAFAAVEKSDEKEGTVSIEIRTYNSRNLDMAIRLPAGFSILEEKIKTDRGVPSGARPGRDSVLFQRGFGQCAELRGR